MSVYFPGSVPYTYLYLQLSVNSQARANAVKPTEASGCQRSRSQRQRTAPVKGRRWKNGVDTGIATMSKAEVKFAMDIESISYDLHRTFR
eukprot:1258180-Amorphochlora_amoeboformis.AAC.1